MATNDRGRAKRSQEELLSTAYHEAGHAVVALALGLPIADATISLVQADVLGELKHHGIYGIDHEPRERRRIARDLILVSYAGMPAQRLVDADVDPSHGDGDERNAFETSREFEVFPRRLDFVGSEAHLAYLERLRSEAVRLVRRNQLAIRHLAVILQGRILMTGSEIEEALKDFSFHGR